MRTPSRPAPLPLAILAAALLIGHGAPAVAAGAAPDGKALYATKCAMCHGLKGVAGDMWAKKGAPNFNDAAWQKTKTDEALIKSVEAGNPVKMMPSYKDKMTADEIKGVVKHIRSLATPGK